MAFSEARLEWRHPLRGKKCSFARGECVSSAFTAEGRAFSLVLYPGGKLLNAGAFALYVRNDSPVDAVNVESLEIECDAPGSATVKRRWSCVALRAGADIGEERLLAHVSCSRGATFIARVRLAAPPPYLDGPSVPDVFLSLLESGEGADVTLRVGASDLKAHSFILRRRSPHFAACLATGEGTFDVPGVGSPDVAIAILRYLYGDEVPDVCRIPPIELARGADALGLDGLRQFAEDAAAQHLAPYNAVETLLEAGALDLTRALDASLEYIKKNIDEVSADASFDLLPKDFFAA